MHGDTGPPSAPPPPNVAGLFKVYDYSLAQPRAGTHYLPSLGTLARQDYAKTVVDISVHDDVHAAVYDSNVDTFASIVAPSVALNNGKSRVGVTSTNGVPEKLGYDDYDTFVALPDFIRGKICLVLQDKIKLTKDVVNDASLKSQDILPLLDHLNKLKDIDITTSKPFELSIGRGVTRARYAKICTGTLSPFIVDIYTYTYTSSALEGLAFQLSQFESDISLSTLPSATPETSFGTITIQTPHGYISSTANLVITITIHSGERLEPDEVILAAAVLGKLHGYITPRCCARSQARKPVLLVQNVPLGKVKQNEGFEVSIYPRDMVAERVEARSDNGALVMVMDAAGGGIGDDKVRFWTLGVGNPPNSKREVRCEVLAAQRDTFYPMKSAFGVSVAD